MPFVCTHASHVWHLHCLAAALAAIFCLVAPSSSWAQATGDKVVVVEDVDPRINEPLLEAADLGRSANSYRQLIKRNKTSVETIDFQYEIVRTQRETNPYGKVMVEELIRLLKLVQLADEGSFTDTKEHHYDRKRRRVELLVRQWASQFHREAQKHKNPDLYVMAYFLYKYYLETFPSSPKLYSMTFFYGELLYKLQKWDEAKTAYKRALRIEPDGQYTNDAARAVAIIEDKESRDRSRVPSRDSAEESAPSASRVATQPSTVSTSDPSNN